MNPLPLVLATLRRYKTAFALFIALVALAVGLGVAISAAERALRQGSARAADKFDLVVGAPGSRTDLVLAAIYLKPGLVPLLDGPSAARAMSDSHAKIAAPIGFGDHFKGAPVVGTISAFVEHLSGGLAEGRPFKKEDEAVVGASSSLKLGDTFRPQHGVDEPADGDDDAHEHAVDITVVGRMRATGTPWDSAIVIPIELVWKVHGLPDGHDPSGAVHTIGPPFDTAFVPGVPAVILKPDSVNSAYGLRNALKSNSSMAFFPAEVLVDLYGALANVSSVMGLVAAIAEVLVAIAVLAALAALFALNRRQFMTLRVMGAPRLFVGLAIWLYIALIILAGAALGLVLGFGTAAGLSTLVSLQTGISLRAGIGAAEIAAVAAFALIGCLCAVIPAYLATRGDAVTALNQA